jgi:large subunit ribosomal protein L10
VGLNLNDKKAVVAEVSAQVANAQTIVIAEYHGVAVGQTSPCCAKRRASLVCIYVC